MGRGASFLSLSRLGTSAPQKPQSRIPAERYRFIFSDRGHCCGNNAFLSMEIEAQIDGGARILATSVQRCDSFEFGGILSLFVRICAFRGKAGVGEAQLGFKYGPCCAVCHSN